MRVLLTGSAGMLGSSLLRSIEASGHEIYAPVRADLDLRSRDLVRDFIGDARPDVVIHAAARVAGIAAKLAAPMDFLLDNLLMDSSVIDASVAAGVPKLVYIGSAAVYPAVYERPFVESDFLTGALEAANEGYGLSKAAAVKLCQYASAQHGVSYRAVLPSNLYGPHDHFGSSGAHLIAAALTKVHFAHISGAPTVEVWGDGTARREFVFSEDLASWIVDQLPLIDAWPTWLNLGVGEDHSVADYYRVARDVVGYQGELAFDTSKPSGVPRRLIDSQVANSLGWRPTTSIEDGMAAAYAAFVTQTKEARDSQ